MLELMDSEYGFFGELKHDEDGKMYLQTHAYTNIAWDAATRAFVEENSETGLKFYNLKSLFGQVMTTRQPVISNDPKSDSRACGVPAGHPPLNSFLGIPFFEQRGTKMMGMVGIANKPGGYTDDDLKFIEPFAITCSNLIQAHRIAEENKRLISTLEETVRARTSALELANKELAEVNRTISDASLAQRRHFACMSHEIRTPLNCVIGLSNLLAEDPLLTPIQRENLNLIVSSGSLLLNIVNDVLDFAKLQDANVLIRKDEASFQEILDTVVQTINVRCREKSIQLETSYGLSVPPTLFTDSQRLRQILFNLLGNAIKFSNPGSVVKLTVEAVSLAEGSPEHGRARSLETASSLTSVENAPCTHRNLATVDSYNEFTTVVRFQVTDYGVGIEKHNFKKIFDPFLQATKTTEHSHGGTGLGLTIASSLIKTMGGRIFVDSKMGEYTTFTVDHPLRAGPVDFDALRAVLSDCCILVVDSGTQDARPANQDFDRLGISYSLAESFEASIELAKSEAFQERYRTLVLVTHEDNFHAALYDQMAQMVPTKLVTYGARYSVPQSTIHHRSLSHVLPSVFVADIARDFSSSLLRPTKPSPKMDPMPEHSPPYGELRILAAEDNMINQKVLRRMFEKLGIRHFKFVQDGKLAVGCAIEETFDLVLMDMQMPVMGGIEACRRIVHHRDNVRRTKRPRVVFISANVSQEDKEETRAAGGAGFIPKPFSPSDIHKELVLCQKLVQTTPPIF
jgi:signal transduction histidine kinase/CheY-like chemotaxis protein